MLGVSAGRKYNPDIYVCGGNSGQSNACEETPYIEAVLEHEEKITTYHDRLHSMTDMLRMCGRLRLVLKQRIC